MAARFLGVVPVSVLLAASVAVASPTAFRPSDPKPVSGRADVPSVSSISPARADLGTNGVTLTVSGANFTRSSVVRWNGADRSTTYMSSTQLQAAIPASDLAAVNLYSITVFTHGGNGGTSNGKGFTVGYPVAVITTLSPSPAPLGGDSFTLTVTGSKFFPGATVLWNDAARPTIFEGPERLSAAIPASDLTAAGNVSVRVSHPGTFGTISASQLLSVSLPTPTITSLSPANRAITPYSPFAIVVSGQGFMRSGSVVRWNGQPRDTYWRSPTQVEVLIPFSDVDTAGTARVTVVASFAGVTKESGFAAFQITNPLPSTTSPNAVLVGSSSTLASMDGSGFLPGVTMVRVNGRHAGFASSFTSGSVAITAEDVDSIGSVRLEVTNPPPGGGTSTRDVPVVNPVPVVTSARPTTALRGGAAFTLVVSGSRFTQGAVIRWNGSDRPTTRVSVGELRASIPAADITRIGDARITVVNPAPGGGASSALTVTVLEQAIRIPD